VRRAGNLWPAVVSFAALRAAALRASRGKRQAASVARFLERLEPEVLRIQRELDADTWRPGDVERFEIHDPKRRTITAVPFEDRVVHHALIEPLESVFERRMITDSFACRKGKGTHAALDRVQRLARRHAVFLKLDVAAFFDSVSHDVVRTTLVRIVKDRRVLRLCDRILRGPAERQHGVGLPIGSLTSQWFANLVLDRLDHHVKENLRAPGFVRYMDDMVLFADEKATLHAAHAEVSTFLRDELKLRLKNRATVLAPVQEGIPFLGWRVHRGLRRVRPENLRRYRWRLRWRRWQWERGDIDDDRFRQSVASVLAHLGHGDTRALRRGWFASWDIEPRGRI